MADESDFSMDPSLGGTSADLLAPPPDEPPIAAPPKRSPTVPILAVVAIVGYLLAAVFLLLWLGVGDTGTSSPNLIKVADTTFAGTDADYRGDKESLSVKLTEDSEAASFVAFDVLLTNLGFSSATSDRIGRTRALDGTLSATGKHVNATWTYHPDHGLQVVFESDG